MPVVLWYAFANPPSITMSLPFARMGDSPFPTRTGTCPFIMCLCGPVTPNASSIMSHTSGLFRSV